MTTALTTKKVFHRCIRCNKQHPHAFRPFCDCDGLIDTEYDLTRVTFHDHSNPLIRYFDLLPLEDPANLLRLPLTQTPCVHATKLGKLVGMPRLYLKDETKNPTATTKDRMAAVALSYLKELGVKEFCTSSTGNSSSSFANVAKLYPECRIYLFTAGDFEDRVQHGAGGAQVLHFVLRGATFVGAFNFAGRFALRKKAVSERGFFNPGRREGLKLAYLEAAEQVPETIDWYVQAVSSAMGVYGAYKGARELEAMGRVDRLPRLLCVQQETCSPMARAFLEGSENIKPEHIVDRPSGIAQAILRGDPTRSYPYAREIVVDSNGTFVSVTENEIREARTMIAEYEGIDPCFSASTSFAGLLKLVRADAFPKADTVLVNLTGGDRPNMPLPDEAKPYYLKQGRVDWEPESPDDPRYESVWPPAS